MNQDNNNYELVTYLDTGIFPATILLSIGLSHKKLIKHLSKHGKDWKVGIEHDSEVVDNSRGVAMHREVSGVHYYYLVFKDPIYLSDDYNYCVIAHEVLHLCQFILPRLIDRNREIECEAYFHTHVMSQVIKAIKSDDR